MKLAATLLVAPGVLVAAAPAAFAADRRPPCAACIVWEADVVRAPALEADPSRVAEDVARSRARALVVVLPPGAAREASRYALEALATSVRAAAVAEPARIAVEGDAREVQDLLRAGAAAYVDAVVAPERPRGEGAYEWWRRHDGPASVPELLEATRAGPDAILASPPSAEVRRDVQGLARWLTRDLAPFSGVRVTCAGCASEVFLRPDLAVVALVRGPGAVEDTRVEPPARRVEHVPVAEGLRLVVVEGWRADEVPGATVEVHARAPLSVEEIVARHRASAARQARAVRSVTARGSLVLTFQAPGLAAPMVVTAGAELFQGEGALELAQTDVRLNGVAVAVRGSGVPALPLLDAERAVAAPLAIVLGEHFRYRLDGIDSLDGVAAYRVAFTPAPGRAGLPSGTAWIAADDFGLARLDAARGDLKGPIVASRQRDTFTRVALPGAAGGGAWLLARSDVHQSYEGAAHRTPVRRVLDLAGHELNAPGFPSRRAAAHASRAVIVRETPGGFRYLERAEPAPVEGARPAGSAPPVPPGEASLRRVAAPATRLRTLAAGVLVDPDVDRALPFAGLGYADLDVLGSGAQLDAFLAGPFARAAVSTPRLGRGAARVHLRLFASLVEYNHRSFRAGREQYGENLRQRPWSATVSAARPLGARTRLRLDYEVSGTPLRAGDTTASGFRAPPDLAVHTVRPGLERDARGWTLDAWVSLSRRARWRAWGDESSGADEDEAAAARVFQRAGVSLSRPFVLSPRAAVRVDLRGVAGIDLDRFSRFAFDGLEDRLRGYPSASLRFDRGAALRVTLAAQPRAGLRLDGFLDGALVRAPDDPRRAHAGAGLGAQVPLPGRLLAALEWGYGFRAPRRDGGQGAHVLRATAYRVF